MCQAKLLKLLQFPVCYGYIMRFVKINDLEYYMNYKLEDKTAKKKEINHIKL
jgi:hypothetical protein